MKLVIVESPTKAKTLVGFLPGDYKIMASMGHLRDLPKKKLGIEIENNFQPQYTDVAGKEKVIKQLKKAAKEAEEIILATDLDREGEAIAYHIAVLLSGKSQIKDLKSQFKRITFHEITKKAIEEALRNPGVINLQLVAAQQARRILDRLVGYKLSPLLWQKIRKGLSAGRVQSPAVRLIVEKEREIKSFKPEEYWRISARLKNRQGEEFTAWLVKIEGKKAEIKRKKEAKKIVEELRQKRYQVWQIKKEVKKIPAPPPFITSTLQRSAGQLFHWSAKKTMRCAQLLYEKGLITYHRTDSFHLSFEALAKARAYLKEKFGQNYLPSKANVFKTKSKLAQEAHEAIRPTKISLKLKIQSLKLHQDEEKLLKLIFKRFLASQMKEELLGKDIALIKAGNYLLQAKGENVIFPGWKKIYQTSHLLKENKEDSLPCLKEGETLQLLKVLSQQKFTLPPSRYTEGSLIKALEEKGIGRPSTYATIISTIQSRQYVEKEEGFLKPTVIGEIVTDFILSYFPKIIDYHFTAQMENDLDKIAQGKKEWQPVIKNFYEPFEKKLIYVVNKIKRIKIEGEKTGEKCPQCGKGEQVVRIGPFGKFLSCSDFPHCRWKESYQEKIRGMKCPQCKKGEIIIRKTKKGKKFYGCSLYPQCSWASWNKPQLTKKI